MKTCKEYRDQAWAALDGRWNQMAVISLIIFAIAGIGSCMGGGFKPATTFSTMQMMGSGLSLVLSILVLAPLQWAMLVMLYQMFKNEEMEEGYLSRTFNLFKGNYSNFVVASVLISIVIVLLAIPTLFIGAFIFAYAYQMVPFILKENPDMRVVDAMRESRMMMRGHKWHLFLLELSFIGWALLCVLTLCIGFLWLVPYQYAATAAFYDDVKAEYYGVDASESVVNLEAKEATDEEEKAE